MDTPDNTNPPSNNIFNAAYADEYVIPSGLFNNEPIDPDILMQYQKDLLKRMAEDLWTVVPSYRDRYWDWPLYSPPRLFTFLIDGF